MSIKRAGAMLAGLHVLESFADMIIAKHDAGEHVTFGDVAKAIADNVPAAVREAGIENDTWRAHKPARKPGRRAGNGQPTG